MKRCPECRRDYYDDTLLYCLDDGSALLEGPASGEGSETARLPNSSESPTAILSDRSSARQVLENRRRWVVVATVVVLGIAGVGFALFKLWPETTVNRPQAIKIERLTTNGRAKTAAISPDGKFYVYTVDEGGKHSLWVRQLAASSNMQIMPAAEDVFYWGIGFTPDSTHINFVKVQFEKNVHWSLYQMPVLGGTQKKLVEDADGGLGYSPDGKQIAYLRSEHPTADESSLVVSNIDGTGERILASRKAPQYFAARGHIPAWSPDGKTIACIIGDESEGRVDIVEINVADGTVTPITTQAWAFITQIAWLKEKSGLVILGVEKDSRTYNEQIWSFTYPAGEARRITADFNKYESISLTADLDTLVTVQSSTIANLWVAPSSDASRAVQIKSGGSNREGMDGLAWTPDGRIVYNSRASGIDDIWIMKANGSEARQFTADAGVSIPSAVTPDGRYLIYAALRDEHASIWRMDLDGSNPKQLIGGNIADHPSVTPDSRWVIYTSVNAGNTYLWKVSIDGGDATQLMTRQSNSPVVSPDGKWIACSYRHDNDSTWRYAIIPIEGGEPTKVFDLLGKQSDFRWAPDGRSLYYLRDTVGGVTNIWSMPLDGKPPSQLTDFKAERTYNFAQSQDGKQFALARGTTTSDVVLIKDFH